MTDKELKKELEEIKKRLTNIEKTVFPKTKSRETKTDKKEDDNYKGLSGGIRLLIDEGSFETPRKVHDIVSELNKKGYHYPKPSISKLLQIDFTTKQRLLNKIRDGHNYKYVIRK